MTEDTHKTIETIFIIDINENIQVALKRLTVVLTFYLLKISLQCKMQMLKLVKKLDSVEKTALSLFFKDLHFFNFFFYGPLILHVIFRKKYILSQVQK